MKIKKDVKQKNFEIDLLYYTLDQIKELMDEKKLFYFDRNNSYFVNYNFESWINSHDEYNHYLFYGKREILRVFSDDLTDLKIELFNGYYKPVVVDPSGYKFHVLL